MSELLHVSSSPHVRSKVSTGSIMRTVFLQVLCLQHYLEFIILA